MCFFKISSVQMCTASGVRASLSVGVAPVPASISV